MTSSRSRIVIAGAHSGVGKTSVTLAVISALRRRGFAVQTFKIGPDYLDPTYLAIASDRDCYNLDGWMTGRDYVVELFVRATRSADVAVVEGVMGLYDGAETDSLSGSTAEAAMWLDAPVLLVVNVHGMAGSLAALVKGYAEFAPDLRLAGVIANQAGSERHGQMLARALDAAALPPLVGAIRRGAFPEMADRHLGLLTADERILGVDRLDALAAAMESHARVDEIIEIARTAAAVRIPADLRADEAAGRPIRLGLAYDAAFHFYYPDNLEALEAHGCELIRFSPLDRRALPEDLDAVYFGGGYPEEYAEQLSANESMRESVRLFAESGRPVYGECGGLMYLSEAIETLDGRRCEMLGLLPAQTRMLDRLKSLRYVEVELTEESLFGPAGATLRGHEFHYSEMPGDPCDGSEWQAVYRARRRRDEASFPEGFQYGSILASYIHLHFGSNPDAVRHFCDLCRRRAHTTHKPK